MLAESNHQGNSNYPPCQSDYEARPVETPRVGKWSDQLAPYTHSLSWIDNEGTSHSLTIRSNSINGLLNDLRIIKGYIRAARGKHAGEESAPVSEDVLLCTIHDVNMARRVSRRTGGSYFSHQLPSGELCYGRRR